MPIKAQSSTTTMVIMRKWENFSIAISDGSGNTRNSSFRVLNSQIQPELLYFSPKFLLYRMIFQSAAHINSMLQNSEKSSNMAKKKYWNIR